MEEKAAQVVARIPVLVRQVDMNGQILAELSAFLNQVALTKLSLAGALNPSSLGSPGVSFPKSKALKSSPSASQKRISSPTLTVASPGELPSTTQNALAQFRAFITAEGVEAQAQSKLLQEMSDDLKEFVAQINKERSELIESIESEEKRVLDERDKTLSWKKKKEKESLKAWDILQTKLKSFVTNRTIAAKEKDSKKLAKMEAAMKKQEEEITKAISSIIHVIKELESNCSKTNTRVQDYYFKFCGEYMASKLKNMIELQAHKTTEVIQKYADLMGESSSKLSSRLAETVETSGKVEPKLDSSQFLKAEANVSEFLTKLPAELVPDLPVTSELAEKSVMALIKPTQQTASRLSTSEDSKLASATSAYGGRPSDDFVYEYEEVVDDGATLERVTAIYTFVGDSADQMTFNKDDVIVVTDKSDSYWWGGYLESDESMTEKWFPMDHVH